MLKQIQFLFFTLLASSLIFLSACSTSPELKNGTETTPPTSEKKLPNQAAIDEIYQLNQSGNTEAAQNSIARLKQQPLLLDERILIAAAEAQSYNQKGEYDRALEILSDTSINKQLSAANNHNQSIFGLTKADTLTALNDFEKAAQLRVFYTATIDDIDVFQKNQSAIWHDINQLSETDINTAINQTFNPSYKSWLQLNYITRFNTQSLDRQIAEIALWQHTHPIHPAALIPPNDIAALRLAAIKRPAKIAIILPFDSKYKKLAKAIADGIAHAYYLSNYKPIISFYSADKQQAFIDIYEVAVNEGAELIIGPLFKTQLEELYALGNLPVPTISLNKLNNSNKPSNLIEFSLSSEDEIDTTIDHLKRHNKRNALLLSQAADWAQDDSSYFTQQWQAQELQLLNSQSFVSSKDQSGAIQQLLNINKSKQRIRRLSYFLALELKSEPRRRKDADFVYLLAKPKQARSIRPMFKFHYASDLPIYANSSVYRGYANPSIDRDFNQINFTDLPWIISPPQDMDKSYAKSFLKRMYAFGFDALQLSERLSLMQNMPNSTLNGATGTLQLNNNILHRTTAMAYFKNSKAQLLPVEAK